MESLVSLNVGMPRPLNHRGQVVPSGIFKTPVAGTRHRHERFTHVCTRNRPQQRLFALDALGEDGWLKALRLDAYAPRRPAPPQVLQGALLPCQEG